MTVGTGVGVTVGTGVLVNDGVGLAHPDASAKTKVSSIIRTHEFTADAMGNDTAIGHYNMP